MQEESVEQLRCAVHSCDEKEVFWLQETKENGIKIDTEAKKVIKQWVWGGGGGQLGYWHKTGLEIRIFF